MIINGQFKLTKYNPKYRKRVKTYLLQINLNAKTKLSK